MMPNRQRLYIEGHNCLTPLLVTSYIHDFLNDLTDLLDMRILVPPNIVKVPVENAGGKITTDDFGVSGFLIWLESGAQIHTWPSCKLCCLDIFSCKPFCTEDTVNFFKFYFLPDAILYDSPFLSGQEKKYITNNL